MAREFYEGMGQAVAERTILRKKENGEFESWADVAHRVALGNSSLCPDPDDMPHEYNALHKHLSNGTTLLSGRHLQHGDAEQAKRNMEIYTNCATSSTSFMTFYLLMNGSGVGRCYDDDMILVNWDNAPTIQCVLDHSHPDYDWSAHESLRDAKHKYGSGRDVIWYEIDDSREGWAKALEFWENAAFEKIHKDKLLIFDFSKIRKKNSPIRGMQNRPASGPVPLMNAFNKAATLRGAGLAPWKQAIYIDHYFAECVLVGGARRAARMSTKHWKDKSVLDFITIKRPIEYCDRSVGEIIELRKTNKLSVFLWSSNNSVVADDQFWELLGLDSADPKYSSDLAQHARKVFQLITSAAYADGTGEPGIINSHKLNQVSKGIDKLRRGQYIRSEKYQVNEDTELYLDRLLKRGKKKSSFMIVNPCVVDSTWIQTSEGPRQVSDLIDVPFTAIVNGKEYTASGFWKTGYKAVYRLETKRGYAIELTEDHRIQIERTRKQRLHGGYNTTHEWVAVKDLKVDDRIVLHNHSDYVVWPENDKSVDLNLRSFEAGWLVGEIVGDGGYNPELYNTYVRFWGKNKTVMTKIAVAAIRKLKLQTSPCFKDTVSGNVCETTTCADMKRLCEGLIEPRTKRLLTALEKCGSEFYRGFLSGLFDADGTVLCNLEKGRSVRLTQTDHSRLVVVQRMLARLGIISSIYENRREPGYRKLPDGKGGYEFYWCDTYHELVISKDNIIRFADLIGFCDPDKSTQLARCISTFRRGAYKERYTTEVKSIEHINDSVAVYDCTVDQVHAFDANGIMAHNCGEIPLAIWGAFCVIADVVPFHAETLDEAEDAFRTTARSLIRVNLMDSVYKDEVTRTNRIGVGMTGIHEFAWKFFKLGFFELIDEQLSKPFWECLSRFKRAVDSEVIAYSNKLGLNVPHTNTTLKPAGTTSKLFGLTEGAHLPAMEFYMRWVQFSVNDPLVEVYKSAGYPFRELQEYQNTVIIGFPTSPVISHLGMGDRLVTASNATPEQQFQWLMLLEKYWLRGVDEDGNPLQNDTGNQISYTLKYDPDTTSYDDLASAIRIYQPQIKCCTIMPQEKTSNYEYLPEQAVTKAEYEAVCHRIKSLIAEDVDFEHVDCQAGACPIDFNKS